MTGIVVLEAITPGRCAAIPAPAIMTSIPSGSIVLQNSSSSSGFLCAEIICFSLDIPKLTQRLPGSAIHFEAISMDEAQRQLHLAQYRYQNAKLHTIDI